MNTEHTRELWAIEYELGVGTFSKVFSAVNTSTGLPVVIKYPLNSKSETAMLEKEARTMSHLQSCRGVPKLLDASHCPEYIVMQKVGRTLLSLRSEYAAITSNSVIMVALKAVDALEDIHNCGYVHKDIKPDNIAISLDPADPTIYLLDLGLSSRYSHAGIHTAYSETEEFVGSPFFASINSIRGVKPSRRDDLESLGYVLLFLLHGNLPWFQAAAASTANLLRQVLKIREKYPIKSLCSPEEAELGDYLDYCQGLGFSDKPNYEGVRQYFWAWRDRIDAEVDWVYDWTPRRKEKIKGKAKTTNSPKVRKDKRRLTSSRISPSKNMTVLETHSPVVSPGLKIKALQHFSIQLQNPILNISSSSGERSPDSVKTPVHGIEQLPSFTSRSRKLFPLRTQKDHGPSTTSLPEPPDHSKQRRFTCDESSFSQEETESP